MVHLYREGGSVRDVHSGREEIQDLLGLLHLDVQVVSAFVPGICMLLRERRELLVYGQIADVVNECQDVLLAHETAFEEIRYELDAGHVRSVGVGTDLDGAYVVSACVAVQREAGDVNVSQDVSLGGFEEVRAGEETHPGGGSGIQMQGMKVRIGQEGVEAVLGVVGPGGEVEQTLEEEVKVWIVGHDFTVEGILPVVSVCRYAGVVVIQGIQAGNLEGDGVQDGLLPKRSLQGGLEGKRPQGLCIKDFAQIQVAGLYVSADNYGPVYIHRIPEGKAGIDSANS